MKPELHGEEGPPNNKGESQAPAGAPATPVPLLLMLGGQSGKKAYWGKGQSDAEEGTHSLCSGLSCDPTGSVFRDEFDLAILQLQENNRLEILKRKWWEGGKCPKEEDHRAKGECVQGPPPSCSRGALISCIWCPKSRSGLLQHTDNKPCKEQRAGLGPESGAVGRALCPPAHWSQGCHLYRASRAWPAPTPARVPPSPHHHPLPATLSHSCPLTASSPPVIRVSLFTVRGNPSIPLHKPSRGLPSQNKTQACCGPLPASLGRLPQRGLASLPHTSPPSRALCFDFLFRPHHSLAFCFLFVSLCTFSPLLLECKFWRTRTVFFIGLSTGPGMNE